jgi:uncharacterized membrane protein YoaK (UPF0700 family)
MEVPFSQGPTTVSNDTKVALVALTIASGSLDVTAFLRLGGVFASIMTSNLIFLGLAAVKAEADLGEHCLTALVGYIIGVGIGSAIARPSGHESRLGTTRLSVLLSVEFLVLAVFGAWWVIDVAQPHGWQQLTLLGAVAMAMGLQTAVARELGDPDVGTTYLTGTLTGLVTTVMSGRRPDASALFVLGAILVGAIAGVGLLRGAPDLTPFLAVAAVALTAVLSWNKRRRSAQPDPQLPLNIPPNR